MNKSYGKNLLLTLGCGCALAFSCAAQAENITDNGGVEAAHPKFMSNYKNNFTPVNRIFDHVFDAGTFTELDDEKASNLFASKYDLYNIGACTAVAKTTDTEGTMVGRNLDIYVTNHPSYFFRTKCEGKYKTMGLSYMFNENPTYDEVLKSGVNNKYYGLIPFISSDVMNEHGLYIQMNMRMNENDKDGKDIFSCSGTRSSKGLKSEKRIAASAIPFYLGERCKNVDDVLDYVNNKLDIYTSAPGKTPNPWNLCFVIADASGKYGLLEIAENKVRFTQAGIPGQSDTGKKEMKDGSAQTNFYINPEFSAKQKTKIGLGRYASVKKAWPSVETEQNMFNLMSSISYFQSYFPWCQYDAKSEYLTTVIDDPELLHQLGMKDEYLNKPWDFELINKHPEYVDAYVKYTQNQIMDLMKAGTLRDAGKYWESAYTLVANCSKKTIFIRFNECNKNIIRFSMDEEK